MRSSRDAVKDWGLGFGVWGLGFGVWGWGFGVWGLGFRVWYLRLRKTDDAHGVSCGEEVEG